MRKHRMLIVVLMLLVGTGLVLAAEGLTPMEQLGKSIFFDENLSLHRNQSCASCHGPDVGSGQRASISSLSFAGWTKSESGPGVSNPLTRKPLTGVGG